jgi:hypothetical protein
LEYLEDHWLSRIFAWYVQQTFLNAGAQLVDENGLGYQYYMAHQKHVSGSDEI